MTAPTRAATWLIGARRTAAGFEALPERPADPDSRFHDVGSDFYDNRLGPERRTRTHVRQLEALGYEVTLEPAA